MNRSREPRKQDGILRTHHETPLIESIPLSRLVGRRVWLKMEALQPSGSFKDRGVGTACIRAVERGARSLIASSGGNAGMAVAWAGRKLQVPVTIAVPSTTPALVRGRLQKLGARVLVKGEVWDESHEWASLEAAKTDAAYISPFDHQDIWDGHATMVSEVEEQLAASGVSAPGAVVLSVGGGGLLCGVAQGMEEVGWGSVPLHGVETEGAASLAAAVSAGKLVTLDGITSLAKTLGARRVAERALQWTVEREVCCTQVSDASAVESCLRFLDDHRLLVEPSCGAALALAYEQVPVFGECNDVVFVVCGGSGVTRALLRQWSRQCGIDNQDQGDEK